MTKLNDYIQQSDIKLKKKDSWWFDSDHRRQYSFKLACDLMITHGLNAEEAFDQSQQLDKLFFDRHFNPTTRKEISNAKNIRND